MSRRRKRSAMGEVFGPDHAVIARFVDIWRPAASPVSVNDIAWELSLGAAKVAITFKYAEEDGWVRRTNPRTEQAEYEPTEKALKQWPESGVSVMPALPTTTIGGVTVRGLTEAEKLEEDKVISPLPNPAKRRELPSGDDAA